MPGDDARFGGVQKRRQGPAECPYWPALRPLRAPQAILHVEARRTDANDRLAAAAAAAASSAGSGGARQAAAGAAGPLGPSAFAAHAEALFPVVADLILRPSGGAAPGHGHGQGGATAAEGGAAGAAARGGGGAGAAKPPAVLHYVWRDFALAALRWDRLFEHQPGAAARGGAQGRGGVPRRPGGLGAGRRHDSLQPGPSCSALATRFGVATPCWPASVPL